MEKEDVVETVTDSVDAEEVKVADVVAEKAVDVDVEETEEMKKVLTLNLRLLPELNECTEAATDCLAPNLTSKTIY